MCRVEPTQLAFVILGASMAALALMILVSILLYPWPSWSWCVFSIFHFWSFDINCALIYIVNFKSSTNAEVYISGHSHPSHRGHKNGGIFLWNRFKHSKYNVSYILDPNNCNDDRIWKIWHSQLSFFSTLLIPKLIKLKLRYKWALLLH